MFAPPSIASKNDMKSFEYKQEETTYKIEFIVNSDNLNLNIKNINKIDSFYVLDISFNDIQKKNQVFRIYQSIQEFSNALEGFIKNKNISIQENKDNLSLNIFVFNILNGNKESISFVLYRKENNNKDEIIKYLCNKVNDLEEKYTKLKEVVDKLIKKDETFSFFWENNSNCELSAGGKRIKKIKNVGWNTLVKGNNLLKRNAINIFKIRVKHVNGDKSGLQFGITRNNSIINNNWGIDWHMKCDDICRYKYKNFSSGTINEGDTMTFIADLKNGTLEVKKNDTSLGKLNDLPINEDLVPSVNIYYVDDEVEIID